MSYTTDQMNEQIAKIRELRATHDEIKALSKVNAADLDQAESQMLEMLVNSDLTSYRSALGLVSVSHRLSIRTPKTPEDRLAFFDYLKSCGLFDEMISVNSATLNSFYREQFDAARARGDDSFKIPGLNEETILPILSFKKADA